jgi:hypothetical protein
MNPTNRNPTNRQGTCQHLLTYPLAALYCTAYIGLVFGCSTALASYDVKLKGTAFDLTTQDPIYTEMHVTHCSQSGEPLWGSVTYTDQSGKVFAKKKLDFNMNARQPSFVLNDFRDQYQQQVEVAPNSIDVSLHRDGQLLESKQGLHPPKQDWVVDAGFNHFVKTQWAPLMAGKTVSFKFLAVTRQQFFKFDLNKIEEDDQSVTFSMTANNWFIALVIDPIKVRYDKATQALRGYEGITNLRKALSQDDYFVARIEYDQGSTLCHR